MMCCRLDACLPGPYPTEAEYIFMKLRACLVTNHAGFTVVVFSLLISRLEGFLLLISRLGGQVAEVRSAAFSSSAVVLNQWTRRVLQVFPQIIGKTFTDTNK